MSGQLNGRRVTVFGGAGFVGRHVVQRLARAGALVTVASRDTIAAAYLKPMGDVGQVTPVHASIVRPKTVAAAVEDADIVINLVGILSQFSQKFANIHVRGARNVAEAAAEAGVERLIHVSAIGATADAVSAYARSKAAGQAAVQAAFPGATVLRPSVIFGAEDDFLNRFAGLARLLPVVMPMIGDGTSRMQPVAVEDVADAVMACLTDDAAAGETYELGGPEVLTQQQVIEYVLETIDARRLIVPIPAPLAKFGGFFTQLLPAPVLTMDQVSMTEDDFTVQDGAKTLADLGIEHPTPMKGTSLGYLQRYRGAAATVDADA